MAMRPPGFNTRTISASTPLSSGMCSMTSEMITTSNDSSGKGSWSASPSIAVAVAPAGASPASFIAANHLATSRISSAFWSRATTCAPRR
jgi:hypothetical protein